jgi:hypothetical protein
LRTKYYYRVLYVINETLVVEVVQVDVAFVYVVKVKHLAVNLPGLLVKKAVFLVLKPVICPAEFRLIIKT